MSDLSPITFKRSAWNRVKYQGDLLNIIYRIQVSAQKVPCESCPKPIRRRMKYARVYNPNTNIMKKFHIDCFVSEFNPDGGIVDNASTARRR